MCRTVAVTAFRKFLEHGVRMRFAVTLCTRWYGFVFALMAFSTSKIMVFCRILLEQGTCFLMTRRAIMRWGFLVDVCNGKRHMNRMAGLAGLKVLVCGMFFMTCHAIGDFSVDIMALIASHVCMGTGMLLYLVTLLLMACKAWGRDLPFNLYIKGGMSVGMAA